MPRSIRSYGLDTSVYVRLLTGHPEAEFRRTVAALECLHAAHPEVQLFVSNQVVGEAYVTLQYHYRISKEDARVAMAALFESGTVFPLNGREVSGILEGKAGGAGLLDRLILQDYRQNGLKVLTNDRRMARLPGAFLPGSAADEAAG
jgi:predicted nucleic acid-binding protein